jgi:predicted TIM-barrel fold metal-dependent hydrolase
MSGPKRPVISADSHVNEPPEVFAERLPASLRDRAPHVEVRDRVEYLVVEGMRPRKMPRGRIDLAGEDLARAQAGGWDPTLRMRDQDRDGVTGEVVFPTLALQACFMAPDPAFQLAMARAYNDWVAEVFVPYRHRFAPAAVIPMADVASA